MIKNSFIILIIFIVTFCAGVSLATDKQKDTDKINIAPIGLEGQALKDVEEDRVPKVKRFILPPYYSEVKDNKHFKAVFPLFYYRKVEGKEAKKDIGVLPFYWMHRQKNLKADVFFPFYWRFRSPEKNTDMVLQTYLSRKKNGYDFGFAPFLFFGNDSNSKINYQFVPPLFFRKQTKDSFSYLAGIFYHKKEKDDFHMGLPPLFFSGKKKYKTYTVLLPPLFWRFGNELNYRTITVIPPLFLKTREHGYSLGLFPLIYMARNPYWDRTLITPFYYGSKWTHTDNEGNFMGMGRSHYFPLLLTYFRAASGLSQGAILGLYHWYDNKDSGDYSRMYTPLMWRWGNKNIMEKSFLLVPLFYRHDSPVTDNTMVGLVYWNFHEHHKSRTFAIAPLFVNKRYLYENHFRTWVFPTFDFGKNPKGYHLRLHPVFYMGKNTEKSHFVLAPVVWKFKSKEDNNFVIFPFLWLFDDLEHGDSYDVFFPLWWRVQDRKKKTKKIVGFPLYWDFSDYSKHTRTTVAFPLFFRHRDRTGKTTSILNIAWKKGAVKNNPYWYFTIFPLMGFGHPPSPSGAHWSVLGGFAGWRRQGSTKQLKLLWIPINF